MKNFCVIVSFCLFQNLYPQSSLLPNTIIAISVAQGPTVDGVMNDPAWNPATPISNFTQRELREGEPASERTEVKIVYDDRYLYVGISCFDREPNKIIANELQRDFVYDLEDNFKMILDTHHDKRNGFLFIINPNGARFDALVTDEGDGINQDWNGIWDVKTSITSQGWFAEIKIPFSTLRFYDAPDQVWGINFERNIRRKREQVLWQGFLRNYYLEKLSQAGELRGLRNIHRGNHLEMKPYALAGEDDQRNKITKTGLDVKYAITPTLTLDLTSNTDFAQIEADREQINLTRFPLFYPEKRDFFLEGAGIFNFQLGDAPQPFYSRRIGLNANRELIPILGGVRLVGKTDSYNLGFLNIQTAEKAGEPSTNYTVARVKKDILNQSYVGFIATNKQSSLTYNRLLGIDGVWVRSDIFGSNTLIVGAALAGTKDPGINSNNLAYRLYADFPNDFINHFIGIRVVQKNFNPEVGFLDRTDFIKYSWTFLIRPRPKGIGMQYIEFKPVEVDYYTYPNGKVQSLGYEGRILGFQTNRGETFELNIQWFADSLEKDFVIFKNDTIPRSTYWWTRWEIQFGTNESRPLSSFFLYSWGNFYDGKRERIIIDPQLKFSKHLSISIDYRWNHVRLPQGNFITQEIGTKVNVGFSTTLNSSFLLQWNNEEEKINFNFRIHWIPKLGSDLYLVFNQLFDTEEKIKPYSSVLMMKIAYWFEL